MEWICQNKEKGEGRVQSLCFPKFCVCCCDWVWRAFFVGPLTLPPSAHLCHIARRPVECRTVLPLSLVAGGLGRWSPRNEYQEDAAATRGLNNVLWSLEYFCVYLKSQWLNSFMHKVFALFIYWLPGQIEKTMLILKNYQWILTCTKAILVQEMCLSSMTQCWWTPSGENIASVALKWKAAAVWQTHTTIFFECWPQCGHQECLSVIWACTHNYIITWLVTCSILMITYFSGSSQSWYHFQHLF